MITKVSPDKMNDIAPLFSRWEETLIWSCLQGHMGQAFTDDIEYPTAAQIITGDFCYFAGNANHANAKELVRNIPWDYSRPWILMITQNELWNELIEEAYPDNFKKYNRYAIKKEPDVFNKDTLHRFIDALSAEYKIVPIDESIYYWSQSNKWAQDFCSQFKSYADYQKHGLGYVAIYDGKPVCGASSYTYYDNGIEIEIGTLEPHRRKGLATACAAALIIECLAKGLYPSWDAANCASVALAEKLGYHFANEYVTYEITGFKREPSQTPDIKYVRMQGREIAYRTGMPVGIFAAVHRLQEAGLLTDEEKAVYHEIDQVWFQDNLPNPPFYDDDKPGKPVTWFKTASSGYMVKKLRPLIDMLEKYGKPYDIVYTNFPGRIVYEDEWQVAVYSDNAPGRISPLSVDHLPLYAEVIRQSFMTAARDFNLTEENCPTHTSFITNERLREKIKFGYFTYGYFSNGKLVGFVSLTDTGGGIYELNHLAVLPEVRHLGCGKALLDYCMEKVNELGGTKITIGIIEENTVLKDWYAANKFTHKGTKKFEHFPFTVGYMEWMI